MMHERHSDSNELTHVLVIDYVYQALFTHVLHHRLTSSWHIEVRVKELMLSART